MKCSSIGPGILQDILKRILYTFVSSLGLNSNSIILEKLSVNYYKFKSFLCLASIEDALSRPYDL